MYKKILVPLENSPTDAIILNHIRPLAVLTGASLLLVHVADGWVARNYENLQLAESDEMKADRVYLERLAAELTAEGFRVEHLLALGEPSDQIIQVSQESGVDLIAMATHGHRLIADFVYGETVDKVRHSVDIPVLLLKSPAA